MMLTNQFADVLLVLRACLCVFLQIHLICKVIEMSLLLLVRVLHRILEERNHNSSWPYVSLPVSDLMNSLLKRMNEAGGLYQMFGELGDIILLRG